MEEILACKARILTSAVALEQLQAENRCLAYSRDWHKFWSNMWFFLAACGWLLFAWRLG